CVYSGYLASPMQMQIVKKAFRQNAQALKVCDPVMADNGKLYSAVTTHMVEVFMELCKDSDIITPNPTEACILLGKDYSKVVFSQQELQNMVMELHQKYKHSVVITGARLENQSVICAGFDEKSDRYFTVECNYIPVHFPGTGDLFCAVLTGGVLKGDGLPQACIRATEFVEKCVRATYETGVDTRFGVELEPQLKYLLE
ncbi:MAG: PfkB family carbohydrate kinase, partial [Oscillospiraceae bacterium]